MKVRKFIASQIYFSIYGINLVTLLIKKTDTRQFIREW